MPITAIEDMTRRMTRTARRSRQFVRHPARTVDDARKMLASAQRVLGSSGGAPSPLLRRRSLGRRFEAHDFPLQDIRQAGRAAGGTVNDAYLAGLCGTLRLYHEALGVPVDAVPLAIPVSLRTDDDPAGGNRFAGALIAAPVGEPDPAVRIARIHELVLTTIAEPAIGVLSALAPLASRLPAPLLAALSSAGTGPDVQASNVPGYPTRSYMAGAELTAGWSFGPLPGVAMMVVLGSSVGTCYVGVHYDTAAITDQALFAQCLRAGFDEVLSLKPVDAAPQCKEGASARRQPKKGAE
jgi:diacylglycerol O-acyltransferase